MRVNKSGLFPVKNKTTMKIMCERTAWLRHRKRWLRAAICFPAVIAITFFLFRSDGTRAQAGDGPNTRFVAAGGNLQQALDQAAPGDTIVLEAGAVFTGNFILRKKTGYGLITLISSASDSLPADNRRVSPADAASMPKLVTPNNNPLIRTEDGAHDYRFVGIEFTVKPGIYVFDLIQSRIFRLRILSTSLPTTSNSIGSMFMATPTGAANVESL